MHKVPSQPFPDNLNYGIIGNCKSSALVNEDSSIDWSCLPQFDSPSVFGKILDDQKGGAFKIECDDSYQITQKYVNKTAILLTQFNNGTDAFQLLDIMHHQKLIDWSSGLREALHSKFCMIPNWNMHKGKQRATLKMTLSSA